jgi:hypothetical protein
VLTIGRRCRMSVSPNPGQEPQRKSGSVSQVKGRQAARPPPSE